MVKLAISYFYQIRNFKPNMIPVSTALSDPQWYRPPTGKEYYVDKRGIIIGLRYEPLIIQKLLPCSCPCELHKKGGASCNSMKIYKEGLEEFVDFNKTIKAFEFCANKFNADTIVLIVYETPTNPCSERLSLIEYFNNHGVNCEELTYPI